MVLGAGHSLLQSGHRVGLSTTRGLLLSLDSTGQARRSFDVPAAIGGLTEAGAPATLDTFARLLCLDGFRTATAGTAAEGIERAARSHFDAILVDLRLPDMSGIDVVRRLRSDGVNVPVVVVTVFPDLDAAFDAASCGASGFVDGPLFGDELCNVVRQALSGDLPVRHPARRATSCHSGTGESKGSGLHGSLDPRVRRVIQIIEADPGRVPPVERLAVGVGLSQSRLRHLFTAYVGVPVGRFVADRRLQMAARLLAVTHDRVKEIGHRMGLADLPRFRRLFRARFGMSPTAYRARAQAGALDVGRSRPSSQVAQEGSKTIVTTNLEDSLAEGLPERPVQGRKAGYPVD